jgi:predicted Zn-dependent protease
MIARIVVVALAVAGFVILVGDLGVARDVDRAATLSDRAEAARLLRGAAERTADTAPLLRLGQLELFLKRPERALEPARTIVAREPENAQAWLLLAQAAGRAGDKALEDRARRRVSELVARP